MPYLKLNEINHEDYDYSSPEFQDFRDALIIRGGCKDTNAYKTWNLEFLKNNLTVVDLNKFESKDEMQKSFEKEKNIDIDPKDLDLYLFKNDPPFFYCANNFIHHTFEHFNDLINISEKYRTPGFQEFDTGYNLFIGYETYTNSHIHVFHDFLVNVIRGKKIFYVWNLYDNEFLVNEYYHHFHYHNKNFWERDHSKMKIYKVELNEGDSFILPPYWYHAVYSPGFSIMIAKIYKKNNSPMGYFKSTKDITEIIPKLGDIYNINFNRTISKKSNIKSNIKYYFLFLIFAILIRFILIKKKSIYNLSNKWLKL
jgi:hypothetical protein